MSGFCPFEKLEVYGCPERRVSSSISLYFGTQLIGDANNWPTIKAASSFVGLGVLSTDIYVADGGTGPNGNATEWYINTASFFSQIRNLRVNITATNPNAYVCAVHYQVAQATRIQNVELIATTGAVCRISQPVSFRAHPQTRSPERCHHRLGYNLI